MRLGFIADTHDARERFLAALEILEDRGAEALLHAGDLTSHRMLDLLDGWRVWLARGNGDWSEQIQAAIEATDSEVHYAEQHAIERDGTSIGLVHGEYDGHLEAMIRQGGYDLVVHGHSHEFRDERIGSVRVVNPGALHRTPTPSVCVYDTDHDELERIEV